jgi:hypothetical protein
LARPGESVVRASAAAEWPWDPESKTECQRRRGDRAPETAAIYSQPSRREWMNPQATITPITATMTKNPSSQLPGGNIVSKFIP